MTDNGVVNHATVAKPLNAFEVAIHQHFFAAVLDTRAKPEFVARHIPGAFHIDLDGPLQTQMQSVGSPSTPLVLLLADIAQYETVVTRLAEVGYTHVAGYMSNSLADWEAIGLPLTSGDIENIQPQQLQILLSLPDNQRPILLDVREPHEFAEGYVPTARLLPLEDLLTHLNELDMTHPVAVICATGCRSQAVAALLGQRGFSKVYDVLGGTQNWKDQRLTLERSENTNAANPY